LVKKPATILKKYPDAILADVTSRDDGFETVIPVKRVKAVDKKTLDLKNIWKVKTDSFFFVTFAQK